MGDAFEAVGDKGGKVPTKFVRVRLSHACPPSRLGKSARLHSAVLEARAANGLHVREIRASHRLRTRKRIVVVIEILHIFLPHRVYPVVYVLFVRAAERRGARVVGIEIDERGAGRVRLQKLMKELARRNELGRARLVLDVVADAVFKVLHKLRIVIELTVGGEEIFHAVFRIHLFRGTVIGGRVSKPRGIAGVPDEIHARFGESLGLLVVRIDVEIVIRLPGRE